MDKKIDPNNEKQLKKSLWKKKFELIKDYFVNSDQKLIAWLMLIGITFSVIALVALTVFFPWLFASFWIALTAKAAIPLLISTGQLVLTMIVYAGVDAIKNYIVGKLAIRWRSWLTKKIIDKLLSDNYYLELRRCGADIDNIAQRVQDDVKTIVDSTLSLGFDFFRSSLTMVFFIVSLWILGGALTFVFLGLNIIIPGYLVWAALFVAITAAIVTHFIGKSLANTNKIEEGREANLRQELDVLTNDAENIAQENASNYYQQSLSDKIQDINNIAATKLGTQTKLGVFQNFYMQIINVLPYLLATPLYFTGRFDLAQLMQVSIAFGQVSVSSSWFVSAYETLAKYNTSLDRITELLSGVEEGGLTSNAKDIAVKLRDKDTIKVRRLNISAPQKTSPEYLLRNLNLTLIPKQHVLITGPSGLGKSTLFRIIARTWEYGDGKVSIPSNKKLYFLPQKPTLPHDTLENVLIYPERESSYTEDEYISLLNAIKSVLNAVKMGEFVSRLKEKRQWAKELSPGQQQRIAFARAILKKPDWLFMDEATASLDEESEHQLYTLVTALENTTVVSIGHRQTVRKYHSRIVMFKPDAEKEISIEEQSDREKCSL